MSKVLRVGLVGCGNMGKNHFRALQELSDCFKLSWVIDPRISEFQLSASGVQFGVKVTPDFIKGIDCVVVATPTDAHFQVCSDLLSANVPVLVEKPICRNVEEANTLLKLSQKHNTSLFVGHVERFNPAVEKARQLVKDGFLGQVIHLGATRIGRYPSVRSISNNVLIDLAVHDLDVIQTIVGPLQYISSICHSVKGTGIYDTAEISLISAGGASASIHTNWVTPTKVRALRVTGTSGVCFVDYLMQTCVVYRDLTESHSPKKFSIDYQSLYRDYLDKPHINFEISREEPLKKQLRAWHNWVAENKSAACELCTPEQGIKLLELAEQAIHQAVKLER